MTHKQTCKEKNNEYDKDCICCEWDGKGYSCCGMKCPVHFKETKRGWEKELFNSEMGFWLPLDGSEKMKRLITFIRMVEDKARDEERLLRDPEIALAHQKGIRDMKEELMEKLNGLQKTFVQGEGYQVAYNRGICDCVHFIRNIPNPHA